MNPLSIRLSQLIQEQGPISFARFMEIALYDPEHGFYSSDRPRVGTGGDFFTSVSVGPLFGKLLALQLAELWSFQGRPPIWNLIEQGADRGQLACDVLSALQRQTPECFEATQLWIVEPSPPLQNAQAETLHPFDPKVRWFPSLDSVPPEAHGLYCNELLDAFPCHRLQRVGASWMELLVDSVKGEFVWTSPQPPGKELIPLLPLLPALPSGFQTEACPRHIPWLRCGLEKIPAGWLLAFDYGLTHAEWFHPHRQSGTLSAYAQHRRCPNPLAHPGEQDLTFHLNFTLLAQLARQAGWRIAGYLEQSRFLAAWAPHYFPDNTPPTSPAELKERLAFRSLFDPNLLGSRFKSLLLHSPTLALPPCTGLRFAPPHALDGVESEATDSAAATPPPRA